MINYFRLQENIHLDRRMSMSEEVIFSGTTLEEVAQTFATIVCRKYQDYLEFWQSKAVDDLYEFYEWELRIESEPKKLKKNTYIKMMKVMREPEKNKRFFKREKLFFRSKEIIRITNSSTFYKDLLPEVDVKESLPDNIEYLIDKKNLSIRKKTRQKIFQKAIF